VVPRAWTIYFADMAEREVPDELPEAWMRLARERAGGPLPERLSEEPPVTQENRSETAAVVDEVKRAVLRDG